MDQKTKKAVIGIVVALGVGWSVVQIVKLSNSDKKTTSTYTQQSAENVSQPATAAPTSEADARKQQQEEEKQRLKEQKERKEAAKVSAIENALSNQQDDRDKAIKTIQKYKNAKVFSVAKSQIASISVDGKAQVKEIRTICDIYRAGFPNGKYVQQFQQLSQACSAYLQNYKAETTVTEEEYDAIVDRYIYYETVEVYVVNALDSTFTDSGKEVKNVITDSTYSEAYYATDIDYIYGEAYSSDTGRRVLLSNALLPKQGAYRAIVVPTDETITLEDSHGFKTKAPCYECISETQISDMEEMKTEYEAYKAARKTAKSSLKQIRYNYKTLGTSVFSISAKSSASTDTTSYETSASGSDSEYVFPNSDTTKLTVAEIKAAKSRDPDSLRIGRNEIYARYGRRFQDETLQEYFDSMSWYVGTIEPEDFDESLLSAVEKANAKLIAKYE